MATPTSASAPRSTSPASANTSPGAAKLTEILAPLLKTAETDIIDAQSGQLESATSETAVRIERAVAEIQVHINKTIAEESATTRLELNKITARLAALETQFSRRTPESARIDRILENQERILAAILRLGPDRGLSPEAARALPHNVIIREKKPGPNMFEREEDHDAY
jgi:hypothetical protein